MLNANDFEKATKENYEFAKNKLKEILGEELSTKLINFEEMFDFGEDYEKRCIVLYISYMTLKEELGL